MATDSGDELKFSINGKMAGEIYSDIDDPSIQSDVDSKLLPIIGVSSWSQIVPRYGQSITRKAYVGSGSKYAIEASPSVAEGGSVVSTEVAYVFTAERKRTLVAEFEKVEPLDKGNPVLIGASASDDDITVSWKANSGVFKYAIFRKVGSGKWTKLGETTGSGNESVKATAGSTCSYLDSTAGAGKTYVYTVRGLEQNGSKYVTSYDTNGVSCKK